MLQLVFNELFTVYLYIMLVLKANKTLMMGKIEDKQRSWQRMRWLGSITDSMGMNLSKIWETVKDREAWCVAIHEVSKSRT